MGTGHWSVDSGAGYTYFNERAGVEWSGAEFGVAAATYFVQQGLDAPCTVTDDDLRHVRDRRRDLFAQWAALPVGETLELPFGGGTHTH